MLFPFIVHDLDKWSLDLDSHSRSHQHSPLLNFFVVTFPGSMPRRSQILCARSVCEVPANTLIFGILTTQPVKMFKNHLKCERKHACKGWSCTPILFRGLRSYKAMLFRLKVDSSSLKTHSTGWRMSTKCCQKFTLYHNFPNVKIRTVQIRELAKIFPDTVFCAWRLHNRKLLHCGAGAF